jgi:hypothetical protein
MGNCVPASAGEYRCTNHERPNPHAGLRISLTNRPCTPSCAAGGPRFTIKQGESSIQRRCRRDDGTASGLFGDDSRRDPVTNGDSHDSVVTVGFQPAAHFFPRPVTLASHPLFSPGRGSAFRAQGSTMPRLDRRVNEVSSAAYSRRASEFTELLGSMAAVHPSDLPLVSKRASDVDGEIVDAGCGPGHDVSGLRVPKRWGCRCVPSRSRGCPTR